MTDHQKLPNIGADPLEAARAVDQRSFPDPTEERPTAKAAKVASTAEDAIEKALSPETLNNHILDRECAATSAIDLVLRQLGRDHPTRLSAWTRNEIARLLHDLYARPLEEIVLGGQHLGAGFAAVKEVEPEKKPKVPRVIVRDSAFTSD